MSTTCTSGVWKLDGSQWKIDANNIKLVEGSMGMNHWEIKCLDMVKKDTTINWGSKYDWINQMCLPHTPGVWKLNGSQCNVDENHPKLIEGSIGMYCREIMFVYGSKKTKKWGWNN